MPKMTKKFWNITKNEEAKSVDIVMYGTIGSDEYWDDVCDKTIKEEIGNLGDVKNINVHINSPGGSVFAAVAIANTLKNHKAKVTAFIDGLAASAATIITSACDIVKMPKNALFMIHNPLTWAYGNRQELEKTGILLDKVKDSTSQENYKNQLLALQADLKEGRKDRETILEELKLLLSQMVDTIKNQQEETNPKDQELYKKIYALLMAAHKLLEEQNASDELFTKVDTLFDKLADSKVNKEELLAEVQSFVEGLQNQGKVEKTVSDTPK